MERALARFEREGCCTVDAAELSGAQVDRVRRDLGPWADRELGREDFGAGRYWEGATDGWGRISTSNALHEMVTDGETARHTLDFMLNAAVLQFARAALRTPTFLIDDASIAAYPCVGEAGNRGAGPRGGSALHGWHRDSFNYHGALRGFHLRPDGTDAVSADVAHAASAAGGRARSYAAYGPPAAINFILYLQDSELRIVPGSHADFTEIDGGFGSALLDHISSLKFGEAAGDPTGTAVDPARLSARVKPHPREAIIPVKRGQVVAFHNNLLHSGMLNDSRDERRMYISAFYVRAGMLGAYSRNHSGERNLTRDTSRLIEAAQRPGHPLHAVVNGAAARGDRQVLSIFGAEHMLGLPPAPPGDPFDFLLSLGTGKDDEMIYLTHLSGVRALLSSWGCDEPTAHAGLYHAVYGTAAFDHLSVPATAEQRGAVSARVGAEAERVAFFSSAAERGAADAALCALRDALSVAGSGGAAQVRAALRRFAAGAAAGAARPAGLDTPREVQMLVAVQLADWLMQADGVDAGGFGSLRGRWFTKFYPARTRASDPGRTPYSRTGRAGHWVWVKGGMRGFRAEAYRAMLDLLPLLGAACAVYGQQPIDAVGGDTAPAAAARVAYSLLYDRLGRTEPQCYWRPDAVPEAAKL